VSTQTIGFIGLGNMGGRMARCLVSAGHEVLGYDTREESITGAGATVAASPGAVMAGARVVLLSLPDSPVVEAVVHGDDGLLAHCSAGQTVVDLSTASPESTQRIQAAFAERDVAYLDAGISGGAAAAEKGALTLMVGGDAEALERVRPVLDVFTAHLYHLGASGSGHTVKLLNNFLNAIALSATAEVMVAARKAQLDLDTVLEVLNQSSGVNFATLNRFPKIVHGDYLEGGLTSTLMLKDVTLYLELLAGLGVTSLHSSGPVAAFGLARQLGYADQISNRVVDAIGDVSGGVRVSDGATSR
jgi:3-hydroxyisobutyrate dehydrogenase